jgi:acetolactate synthase-1/3 small subunit
MAARRSLLSLLNTTVTRATKPQASKAQTVIFSTSISQQYRTKSTNSTSALAYKALHRRSPLPLPVADASPSYGAAAAVSSILYETPSPSQAPPKKHILNCLVQNEPGVLSRISGILAARGFNIDSLVVCSTEVSDLSRMTIVLAGLDGVVEQARRQLEDLVPVWAVLDYTSAALVQRELLLAKVSILGPEVYEELMEHHREMTNPGGEGEQPDAEANAERRLQELEDGRSQETEKGGILQSVKDVLSQSELASRDYHPSRLAASQALRHKHEHLEAITHLTHQFGGKVLDISTNNCIVEV